MKRSLITGAMEEQVLGGLHIQVMNPVEGIRITVTYHNYSNISIIS